MSPWLTTKRHSSFAESKLKRIFLRLTTVAASEAEEEKSRRTTQVASQNSTTVTTVAALVVYFDAFAAAKDDRSMYRFNIGGGGDGISGESVVLCGCAKERKWRLASLANIGHGLL
ncbi:hypothetical protein ACFE04_006874 [Oxalis oulophora]